VPRRKQKLHCDACGKAISKKSISKVFDGLAYHFDSDDCLLIFRKLRAIYGKRFFRLSA
jgi:hypothetical protein